MVGAGPGAGRVGEVAEGPDACPEKQAGWRAVAQAGGASVNVLSAARRRVLLAACCCRQLAAAQLAAHKRHAQAALTCCARGSQPAHTAGHVRLAGGTPARRRVARACYRVASPAWACCEKCGRLPLHERVTRRGGGRMSRCPRAHGAPVRPLGPPDRAARNEKQAKKAALHPPNPFTCCTVIMTWWGWAWRTVPRCLARSVGRCSTPPPRSGGGHMTE